MKVKNVNGSSRFQSPKGYSSWLEYWGTQTGQVPFLCYTSNCMQTDLVGAHVQKADGNDEHYYIVPIYRSCNTRDDVFNVESTLVPVPSNL